MITFLDGPAKGAILDLARAPMLLRAVCSPGGTWDALDLPTDEARPDERIVVYRRIGEPTQYHISCRPRSKSRWGVRAEYRCLKQQPDDKLIRRTGNWQTWCESGGKAALFACGVTM